MWNWLFGTPKERAFRKLQAAYATGDFGPAIRAYEAAVIADPTDHELLMNWGVAYFEAGRADMSIAPLQRAVALADGAIQRNNLGRALLLAKRFDEAQAEFARARKLDPADPQPWYNATVGLREAGRTEDAARELQEFLHAFPHHAGGQSDRGVDLMEAGQTEEAIACFRKAIGSNPFHLPALLCLIRLLTESGRIAEAMPYLEILFHLGMKVIIRGQDETAIVEIGGKELCRGPLPPTMLLPPSQRRYLATAPGPQP